MRRRRGCAVSCIWIRWRRWAAALALVCVLAHAVVVAAGHDGVVHISAGRIGQGEASLGKIVCAAGDLWAPPDSAGSGSPSLPASQHCATCACIASGPAFPPGGAASIPWRRAIDRLSPQPAARLASLFQPVPSSRDPPSFRLNHRPFAACRNSEGARSISRIFGKKRLCGNSRAWRSPAPLR